MTRLHIQQIEHALHTNIPSSVSFITNFPGAACLTYLYAYLLKFLHELRWWKDLDITQKSFVVLWHYLCSKIHNQRAQWLQFLLILNYKSYYNRAMINLPYMEIGITLRKKFTREEGCLKYKLVHKLFCNPCRLGASITPQPNQRMHSCGVNPLLGQPIQW